MPRSRGLALKTRPQALKGFTLQPTFNAIERTAWANSLPKFAWYQLPAEQEYDHPSGGKYVRCRVEAFDSQGSLGFLPLPLRYRDQWVQLCYTIVHTRCEWDAWVAALSSPPKIRGLDQNLVQYIANQNGARLLYYLTIQRQIAGDLLSHTMAANGTDHLDVFDEFLIRDAQGWLWKDYKELSSTDRVWLKADPAHPQNARHFDWNKQKNVAPELLPPKDDHSWVRGEITHYDFQQSWNGRLRDVVAFFNHEDLQEELGEHAFRSDAGYYGGQMPEVLFLTEEQDLAFNHPPKPAPRPPSAAPSPSGTVCPPLDCPEARAIVQAFADRTRVEEIPPTVLALERLFGNRFDRELWSKVLDSLAFNSGEDAKVTVDEAWGFVVAAQQAASALPSSRNTPVTQSDLDTVGEGSGLNTFTAQSCLAAGSGGDEGSVPAAQSGLEVAGVDHEARMQAFLSQDQEML